jgi:hypothetical protein
LGELVDPGGVGGLGLEGNCQEEEGGEEAHLGSLSEMAGGGGNIGRLGRLMGLLS